MPNPNAGITLSGRLFRPLIALSALTFLISCGAKTDDRLDVAAGKIGEARALSAGFPDLPPDCRDHTVIRPAEGERLDELALRYAWALGDEHARTDRCAEWYDRNYGDAR